MPVARQSQGYPARGSLGKNLRAMRQKECGYCGIESVERGFQVSVPCAKVIDSSDGKATLLGLDNLMRIDQKGNLIPTERSLKFVRPAIPAFVIAQCGEGPVPRLDPDNHERWYGRPNELQ